MMKKGIFLIIGLLTILALSACAQPTPAAPAGKPAASAPATVKPAAPAPVRGGTLRIADPVGPTNPGWPADPTFARGGHALDLFMDTILIGDSNGNILPNLATEWKASPDLKSITLTLRKGVKFHDGSDWNATSAKWNIDTLITAKSGDFRNVTSIDIVDDYTIKMNIKEYTNTLLTTLAGQRVVSKAAYDKNGEQWMRSHPVGTGPFKLASFEPQVSLKGVRFDGYWQTGKPYLDGAELYIIADPMTRSASLQAGEMDMIGGDLSKAEYDLQQKGFNVVKGPISVYTLVPDSKNADSPFANGKVREALDYAIDRDSIVKSLGYGFWATTYQFALPGTTTYNQGLVRAYDPAKAKQLLADAGYSSGFKTSFIVNSNTSNRDAATAIQGYLGKVGITADMSWVDGATAQSYFTNGWKNGLLGTAASVGANVNSSLSAWTKENVWYISLDKTEDYYNLYRTALTAQNYDVVLTQKAIKYAFDNAMFNSIYAVSRGVVMQSKVHDTGFYTRHNFWYWEPANAWISK